MGDVISIINSPIVLSKNFDEGEDLYENMWAIALSPDLTKTVTKKDMAKFIDDFLQKKREQIKELRAPATFYMWFDEQTAELRFNIITGHHKNLPFGCEIKVLTSAESMIEAFLARGSEKTIPWNEMEILSGHDHEDEIDEQSFVLNVFVTFLTP